MNWRDKNILVTGGASFIGSHLVDKLVNMGANVRVVDDLSSGKLGNIKHHLNNRRVEFIKGNLLEEKVVKEALNGIDLLFHLAANHGGRGYIELHQAACATNMILDGLVFKTALEAGVKKVIFASSGCVYPNFLQTDSNSILYLKEDMVGPPFDADNMYGYAKLMGEKILEAYYKDYGMKSVSCRYFAVYGPRALENQGIIALIARAFIRQNPFEVWGTGSQIRNWTFVTDIVNGTISAAEKIDDSTPINLGTMERIRLLDAVNEILRYTKHKAEIKFCPDMPTGPLNRVADNSLAKKLLDWEPKISFIEGLHRTIDWYFSVKNRAEVESILAKSLIERLV